MQNEKLNLAEQSGADVSQTSVLSEPSSAHGVYTAVCRDADGNVKWTDTVDNVVTTIGKNFLLDQGLNGSAFTASSFIGLISATPTCVVGDTMGSHAGWTEVGYSTNYPLYTAPRKTSSWAGASSGSKVNSPSAFAFITTGGTVGGCFLVINTAAGTMGTMGDVTGTLYSCGAFTGGNKTVAPSDSLTVTYTASLT